MRMDPTYEQALRDGWPEWYGVPNDPDYFWQVTIDEYEIQLHDGEPSYRRADDEGL